MVLLLIILPVILGFFGLFIGIVISLSFFILSPLLTKLFVIFATMVIFAAIGFAIVYADDSD